jgi:type II secretory pathway predicted ATPase ExeA
MAKHVRAYLRGVATPKNAIASAFEHEAAPATTEPESATNGDDPTNPPENEDVNTNEALAVATLKHFGNLRCDPFQPELVTAPEDVYLNESFRYVEEAMLQAAKTAGMIAVVAEPGGGKTVMRRHFLQRIAKDHPEIVPIMPGVIDKTRLSAGSICEAIIRTIAPGTRMPSALESRDARMCELLKEGAREGMKHVLLIEEAHDLPESTLKYLKRFWEIEDSFKRVMAIVLVGQKRELEAKLRQPVVREVTRRLELATLEPLDIAVKPYLTHKFTRIGADAAKVFSDDAYDAMQAKLRRTGARQMSERQKMRIERLSTFKPNREERKP